MSQTDQQASSHWMVRLADSPLFRKLPAANIRVLLEEVEKISVAAGDVIIKQGDRGDYYYIIEEGTCRVTRRTATDGEEELLVELGPGNAFGEEEMVAGASRNATVVMSTDGELLRLAKDRFIDIVRDPLIDKIPYRMASRMNAEGGVYVDVRGPQEFAQGSLPGAISLPLDRLREESDRLKTEHNYIVCGNTPGASAVGTLLLAQMGFDAVCLNEPIEQVLDTDKTQESEKPGGQDRSESPVEQARQATLDHDVESSEPIRRDLYDDTYVGRSLADLIDQMHTRHRELMKENTGPAPETGETPAAVIDLESFEAEVEESLPPVDDESPHTPLDESRQVKPTLDPEVDEFSVLMTELESRLRNFVEHATRGQREHLQSQLALRIDKVKQAAVKEVRRQTQAYRDKYRAEHGHREQAVRAQYDKLMGLAHRISRQKAELQRARRELEGKLQATTRLQHEIDGLRDTLTQSIGHFDELEESSTES